MSKKQAGQAVADFMAQVKVAPRKMIIETRLVDYKGKLGWIATPIADCWYWDSVYMQSQYWQSYYRFTGERFDVIVCSKDMLTREKALQQATGIVTGNYIRAIVIKME